VIFHPGFQQIATFDNLTGTYEEKRLLHRAEAEQFYRFAGGAASADGEEPKRWVAGPCVPCTIRETTKETNLGRNIKVKSESQSQRLSTKAKWRSSSRRGKSVAKNP
jgi:hypothetical protein